MNQKSEQIQNQAVKRFRDLDTEENLFAEEFEQAENVTGFRMWANYLLLAVIVIAIVLKGFIG